MIPHVAQRGSSFQGASVYYLHDKKDSTNERVAWTYTHNLPTMNAQKGFNYMASTAMQAEVLKRRSGASSTGRKSQAKPVYSFSLSWHPEQEPEQSAMQKAALEVLAHLGLSDHEAVLVAHDDEPHPHVHVVANLVHPETGKTASTSYDRLTMSTWAENFEREEGKIYCEQRVENNKERRANANDNKQLKLVKYKEKRLDNALLIQTIYSLHANGKDIQEALENEGYTLAQGRKGRVLLVDQDGNINALSRQLKGQRAKDIREKLKGIETLPEAQSLSEERKHFMRDDYETKRQKMIVDTAIEEEKQRKIQPKQEFRKSAIQKTKAKTMDIAKQELTTAYNSYAEELDSIRAKEEVEYRKTMMKEKQLRDYYNREASAKRLEALKQQFEKSTLPWQKKRLSEQIENLEQSLSSIDQRITEQGIEPENPVYSRYTSSISEDQPTKIELTQEFKAETTEQKKLGLANQIRQRRLSTLDRGLER